LKNKNYDSDYNEKPEQKKHVVLGLKKRPTEALFKP